ncbi:hypothetical protein K7432_001270 [Basidiobolus ranarum]|uniref:Transmembrane protein n=1 Tax=Basidiobolus ranarum TaxID=34480 RepID=A0ABR2X3A6_9FUNG
MDMNSGVLYKPAILPDATKINMNFAPSCKHKSNSGWKLFHGHKNKLIAGTFSTLLLIFLFLGASGLEVSEQNHSHLLKRQNSFTQHGYHWIVIGIAIALFIIIVFAMTYWCCRGAFQNPLCCPCYTLACCGAIQCAECCCLGTIAAEEATY